MSQREWLDQDFYKELGVSSDASADEIKKTYRKLARKLHPDANPGDKEAEARFKRVSEAHSVLSDPEKRKEYDELRAMAAAGARPGGMGGYTTGNMDDFSFGDIFGGGRRSYSTNGQTSADFGDIFSGLFGNGTRSQSRRSSAQRKGANLETELNLSFRDAVKGSTTTLNITAPSSCLSCNGTGSADKVQPKICTYCNGSGYVDAQQGSFAFTEVCSHCDGTGKIIKNPCKACGSTGITNRNRSVTVRIPAGTSDGAKLRLAGQGQAGERGNPAGDLYVIVHVLPDKIFTRQGKNLEVTVPMSFSELALGTTISVPTLDNRVSLKVPAGTHDGQKLRVKGRGVPAKDGNNGDLMVQLKVEIPEHLSEDAKRALEIYSEAEKVSGFDPRKKWAGAQ